MNFCFSLFNLVFFIVSLLGSAMIQAAFILLLSFYSIRCLGESPFNTIYWDTREFLNYSLSLFIKNNVFLQILLTIAIPYTFISFFPCQHFLFKKDFLIFSPAIKYFTPLAGIISICITFLIWDLLIKKYTSSGT